MRHLLKVFLASGLALSGLTLNAQYQPRFSDRDEFRDRERARMFERIRAHLDRAEASTVPLTGDRNRIARAREEVNVLQSRMEQGTVDRRGLDEAIMAVQRVLNDNHVLSDTNRDLLANDLNRLRDMRAGFNFR